MSIIINCVQKPYIRGFILFNIVLKETVLKGCLSVVFKIYLLNLNSIQSVQRIRGERVKKNKQTYTVIRRIPMQLTCRDQGVIKKTMHRSSHSFKNADWL